MWPGFRPAPSHPEPIITLLAAARRWFTEGNVPVKVGMLVLLAGVAALLKYAGDQGWLRLLIELRYAGIAAAAALGGLVLGWRQRTPRRGFALALAQPVKAAPMPIAGFKGLAVERTGMCLVWLPCRHGRVGCTHATELRQPPAA